MKKLTILAALVLLLPAASFADIFQVTMDTTGWTGSTGTIDIQFNPAGDPFQVGTVTFRNFSIIGGSLGALQVCDDVIPPPAVCGSSTTGGLPGPMTISNTGFINGPNYAATFGEKITFEVEFLGLAFTAAGQTNLTSLFVVIGATPGTIRTQIDLLGNSAIDWKTGSTPEAVSVAPLGAIPEPSTYLLVSAGIGVGYLIRRRRRR